VTGPGDPVRGVDPAFHLSFDGPASGQWETPLERIRITVGEVSIQIDPRDTPTARAMIDALPFEATASTWGDEVYFRTPVSVAREPEARDVVEPGEIAYWPDGDAIAICFGPTPIARAGESRLASRSNVWGDALDDVRALKAVQSGARVRVEKEG
jgi:hypothetical protein